MAHAIAVVRRTALWLDRWHWAWLILAAPFLLFPSASRSVALLSVPLIWIVGLIARRAPVRRTPFNLVLLSMFIMVLVSEWATYDLAFSLPKLAGMVLGIGIFFAFVRIGGSSRGWWVACVFMLLSGVGIAALGLIGTKFGTKLNLLAPIVLRLSPRLLGLPGAELGFSPNELAGALVWLLPLFITLTVICWLGVGPRPHEAESVRTVRFALALGTLVVLGVLVLTQSRGGYLGIASALILLILFTVPQRLRTLLFIVVLVGIIIGIGFLILQPEEFASAIASANGGDTTDAMAVLESANGRMEVWARAMYGIEDFPFTGMGMNTFRKVVGVLYPFFLISPDADVAHAHNEFLQAGLDLGVPGLIAFIALYLIAYWMLSEIWHAANQFDNRNLLRALALGFGGGLFAHIIYGMTDAVALGAKPGFIFWMMLGLIAALHYQIRPGQTLE